MPFVTRKGLSGFVWEPEEDHCVKRKPCKDCKACAQCGENRCRYCRSRQAQQARPKR